MPVALTRVTCACNVSPANAAGNTVVTPVRSTTETLPAPPTRIARQPGKGKSAASLGVIARKAPAVCVDVLSGILTRVECQVDGIAVVAV